MVRGEEALVELDRYSQRQVVVRHSEDCNDSSRPNKGQPRRRADGQYVVLVPAAEEEDVLDLVTLRAPGHRPGELVVELACCGRGQVSVVAGMRAGVLTVLILKSPGERKEPSVAPSPVGDVMRGCGRAAGG
jgi:hypothetical protein